MTAEERARRLAVQRGCSRFLTGERPQLVAELLADIASAAPADTTPDFYGTGELIEDLEARLTEVLGTEAAVFLPSGTLGQQAVLRSWADRAGNPVVALHALGHLLQHEDMAVARLHGLQPVHLTTAPRQSTAEDVVALREPVAAVVVELPLREPGYLLPTWAELVALVDAIHNAGAKAHLDGARLWESAPYLGHSCAEIAELFDSAYVSFYKGLQAPAGAAVVGDRSLVEQVRLWQHRHGGTLFTAAPLVVAAQHGLTEALPRVADRVAHARLVASALVDVGVRVHPDPPHTNAFRVYVEAPTDALDAAVLEHAEQTGDWLLAGSWQDADVPGWSVTEHTVMDGALDFTPDQMRASLRALLARLP